MNKNKHFVTNKNNDLKLSLNNRDNPLLELKVCVEYYRFLFMYLRQIIEKEAELQFCHKEYIRIQKKMLKALFIFLVFESTFFFTFRKQVDKSGRSEELYQYISFADRHSYKD